METSTPVVNKAIYIINAAGRRVPISISTAVLRGDGVMIGGVETFRDLSLVEQLRKEAKRRYTFADIVSKNPRMHRLFEFLPRVAASDSTVLIEGESGTGKELIARAIHNLSPRNRGPFVVVNCGALPDSLLESELFGYKAGAFTDARKDKPGRFALAEGGTIFFDEVGDVSPALQVRLLRMLQERTFEPLGATEPVEADVRIVAATNKSLKDLLEAGLFRQDLYYRINVVRLFLPPLRDRQEDIPLLVEHFIDRFNRLCARDITGVSNDVIALLARHDYPGNVRELEHIIEHAFVSCVGALIESQHLPNYLRPAVTIPSPGSANAAEALKEIEKHLILEALKRNHWNREAAARELGFHRSTIFRKIRSLSLELPPTDGRSGRP